MKISADNEVIAVVRRYSDWNDGLDFVTNEDAYIQIGTWKYDSGKVLDRHEHNRVVRSSDLTQECVFVVSGSMYVSFYNSNRVFITRIKLNQFDYAVILGGGHSYEIIDDNTRILEAKNGPYLGDDLDKTRY